MNSQKPAWPSALGLAAIVLLAAGTGLGLWIVSHPGANPASSPPAAPGALHSPAAAASSTHSPAPSGDAATLRPLPVEKHSATHEWTAGDGKDPKIIEKLSHNLEEFMRMVKENDTIRRRQLVYRNLTVPMLLDRARESGQPLRSFTLPGIDGHEVEVEVTEVRVMPGAPGGSVTGRVNGRPNSLVSVGFSNGCESFNVVSPDDHLYLAADAREPGEVVVKDFDPATYKLPPPSDTPDFILTHEPVPGEKPKSSAPR